MKGITVYLVQLPDALREMVMLAAREVFPRDQLQVLPARTIVEAVRLPGQRRQLLVIGDTSEADLGVAAQALDEGELPRWAVVHIGPTRSDLVESVAPEGCTVTLLNRIFRSAVLHHELLRENLQLRGDLKTLARRFNHDIRTPLACINTACALLQDGPDGPVTGTRSPHETASVIRGATDEIGVLLDRVSFVLRASSEPMPAGPLAMGPVVQQVVAKLTAAHELRGAKVSQPGQWPEVQGVEPWIAFIWTNLIGNAVRHGARHRAIQLGWEPKGNELRFSVASEGAVPPAMQAGLLRPFHLLHQHASAGLGLSLVERLVSLQGGRCGYETTPDKHAVFHFTLPTVRSFARPLAGPAAASPSFAESRAV